MFETYRMSFKDQLCMPGAYKKGGIEAKKVEDRANKIINKIFPIWRKRWTRWRKHLEHSKGTTMKRTPHVIL